jgi:hypothetical protein
MMNLDTWRIISESVVGGSGVTLGLGRRQTLGGPIGSQFSEDFDDDDEDDEYDGQQTDDEDDDHKEGDLVGSSHPDEGPDKNFPPDAQEDDDDMPTPDEEMAGADDFGDGDGDDDFLASLGAGGAGDQANGGDFGDEFGGGDDDFLGQLGAGGSGPDVPAQGGDDLDFLNDLDPNLLGGDFAGDDAGVGDAGGDFGGDGDMGEPCPDCNPDGSQEMGDPHCPSCGGLGHLEGGDDQGDFGGGDFGGDLDASLESPDAPAHHGQDDEMVPFMNKMANYMQKHMRREWSQLQEFAPIAAAAAPAIAGSAGAGAGAAGAAGGMGAMMGRVAASPMMQQMAGQAANGAGTAAVNNMMQPQQQQQQQMVKRMVKFMTKGGKERKFMAADRSYQRKYMKKDADKKCCTNEAADFLSSLCSQAEGTNYKKNWNGVSEDALFHFAEPGAEYAKGEPRPGDVGYAPQGRVGNVGGGYQRSDYQELPVLGESRYPTLAEYAAYKARKAANNKARRSR